MIKLTGLWVNESKEGTKYLKGKLGNLDVLAFRVKDKKENQPEYELFLSVKEDKFKKRVKPAEQVAKKQDDILFDG